MIDAGRADEIIRSPHNPLITFVRSLQRRQARHRERAFIVEGARAVADALVAGAVPSVLLLRSDLTATELPARLPGVATRLVAPDLLDAVSDTVTPQGIIAVFPLPNLPLAGTGIPLALVIDGVRDPGNLGTLLRSAAAAGATEALLAPGTVDAYNPKTVRAAMGAHFRLPIRPLTVTGAADIARRCAVRALAEAGAPLTYERVDWTGPAAIIIGGEATGPSDAGRALATIAVAIPLLGQVESLNAGVAGSLLLFEAARQRRESS